MHGSQYMILNAHARSAGAGPRSDHESEGSTELQIDLAHGAGITIAQLAMEHAIPEGVVLGIHCRMEA